MTDVEDLLKVAASRDEQLLSESLASLFPELVLPDHVSTDAYDRP